MGAENESVVRDYLDAMAKGDLERAGELIAEDVVFHIPGRSRISGEHRGRDHAIAMWRSLLEASGASGFEIDVHDLLSTEDHVVVLATRTIGGVDARGVVVYHVEGGRITGAWVHEADQYAVDAAVGT